MTFDAETVHAIANELAHRGAAPRIKTIEGDTDDLAAGTYVLERGGDGSEKLRQIVAVNAPAAAPLVAHTLDAVVDYLQENRDGLDLKGVIVHVRGPNEVAVLGPLRERRDRECFLVAKPAIGDPLDDFVGRYHAQDDFVLKVQTLFRATPERADLLALVGNLTSEAVKTAVDDGVTQMVTVRGGSKVNGAVKNPWALAPLRSFPEIELAAAPFVLRIGPEAKVALFDASGGAWRIEAIEKIAKHLGERAARAASGEAGKAGIVA